VQIAEQCSVEGCENCSVTALDVQHVCLVHFISACYENLEELSQNTRKWSVGGVQWEFARRFTRECIEGAISFSQHSPELSNLERARLLDLALWATELGKRLRRSPRGPEAANIRLISEKPGHLWVEETQTVDMSRHGARTRCQHTVKNADVLKVLRLDTGEQAQARVVWHRQTATGAQEIGIEFLTDGSNMEG
jgi:hypothetical protein